MAPTRSVQRVSSAAKREADAIAGRVAKSIREGKATRDSFQNFGLNIGQGTNNALSDSTYGFNPISRQRTLIEWIYRGSWLGGVAVNLPADDMTRAGIEFVSDMKPQDSSDIDAVAATLAIWEQINDGLKWASLYGGAIVVQLIEGQAMNTPLRLKTVGRRQFRGLHTLDRWMVEPSLDDLVTELGPHLGLPKFYTVNGDAPALNGQRIHYTRVMRFEGDRLPFQQRVQENLWGMSVYERLYDRMIAFDSATQGAAQLVYKSFIRTYKLKGMRELVGGDMEAQQILEKYTEMMRRFQGIEGITLIDGDDDLVVQQSPSFPGIADALVQFGQQISGALQIPLVRLFGQSPAGMNSTGESDILTYYDGIKHKQERHLKVPVTRVYRALAQSEGIPLPDDFGITFRSLWQMKDSEKATTAEVGERTVGNAFINGIIGRGTALRELKQQGRVTGFFTNITDKEIAEADAEPPPVPEGMVLGPDGEPVPATSLLPQPGEEGKDGDDKPKPNGAAKPAAEGASDSPGAAVVHVHPPASSAS